MKRNQILIMLLTLALISTHSGVNVTIKADGTGDFTEISSAAYYLQLNGGGRATVYPGTYSGFILWSSTTTTHIEVVGVNPSVCIVDCDGYEGFYIDGDPTAADDKIQGLTIRNAGESAIFIAEGSVTINNCVIEDCGTDVGDTSTWAIYDSSDQRIWRNNGGGVRVNGGAAITNCEFHNCEVNMDVPAYFDYEQALKPKEALGGAICGFIPAGKTLHIENCLINGCSAWVGGAIWATGEGCIEIEGCEMTQNTLVNYESYNECYPGYSEVLMFFNASDVSMTNNSIHNNIRLQTSLAAMPWRVVLQYLEIDNELVEFSFHNNTVTKNDRMCGINMAFANDSSDINFTHNIWYGNKQLQIDDEECITF